MSRWAVMSNEYYWTDLMFLSFLVKNRHMHRMHPNVAATNNARAKCSKTKTGMRNIARCATRMRNLSPQEARTIWWIPKNTWQSRGGGWSTFQIYQIWQYGSTLLYDTWSVLVSDHTETTISGFGSGMMYCEYDICTYVYMIVPGTRYSHIGHV